MSERNERDERSGDRRAAEGVRIIGPEEAQAALDAGAAAGRRPEDELRFGDVPPAPAGPRPPHRFPLPDSVDPAEAVPRPPVMAPPPVDPIVGGRHHGDGGVAWVDPGDAADGDTVELPGGGMAGGVAAAPWDPSGPAAHSPNAAGDLAPVPATAPDGATALDLPVTPPDDAAPQVANPWAAGAPAWPDSPDPLPADQARPDEGITVSGGYETELPHWTDPPTGEVPRVFVDRLAEAGSAGQGDEDLAAWEALGTRSTTWRDDNTGWDNLDDLDDLDADDVRVGALDTTRSEHSDLYSFDEDFERLEEERSGQHAAVVLDADDDLDADEWPELDEPAPRVTRVSSRQPRLPRPVRAAGRPRRSDGDGGDRAGLTGELGSRLGIGIGLVVLLVIAYVVGPPALLVLAAAVVTTAAAEVYGMLRPTGFRPATLLGLVATLGVMFAAYWRGPGALPLVVVMVFVVAMLWYLFGVVDARPLANVAVTVSAFVWVGVLGSYSALLLRSGHGRGLFLGAVLPAVAADIVAYFVGRRIGSRPMAPAVSPGKTWEGAVGGSVGAIVVGIVIGHFVTPWGGLGHGVVLGLVVAVLAPVGDLFESMVKRDLSIKDSGSVLSGHGGVLDRFDAVLLCLPAAYYLASLWGYVK